MAGLDPAIHVFLLDAAKNVDARDKPVHDECREVALYTSYFFALRLAFPGLNSSRSIACPIAR